MIDVLAHAGRGQRGCVRWAPAACRAAPSLLSAARPKSPYHAGRLFQRGGEIRPGA